jgi:glycosyltransferase involved in cell wall biosynthesis
LAVVRLDGDDPLLDIEPVAPLGIAIVAPPWFEVPPSGYGGIEAMCHSLADGLTARGHDVTLIGAGTTRTSGRFLQTFARPPKGLGTPDAVVIEALHALRAASLLEGLSGVDVVHDHSVLGPALTAPRPVPSVVTAHAPVDGATGELYRELPPYVSLVAISHAQRATAPDLSWTATIHHGIAVDEAPFSPTKDPFALFIGRIHSHKGPHLAIDAARAAGLPIVLAAKCSEPVERAFFEREIRPRLGSDVEWIGEADVETKHDLLRRACVLVLPLQWDEPFGLVMLEAMASGTPVVALRRGSVSELVLDGVTGFVCDEADELPDRILDATELDPFVCREHARRNFGIAAMVDAYEALFANLVRRHRAVSASATPLRTASALARLR